MSKINKENKALREFIIEAIQDIKGEELVTLDLRALDDTVTDYYMVCHGTSNTQVNAIADSVFKKVKDELGILPKAQEGKIAANWVILDYFDVVVHVFYKEAREYYQLEDLWSDAVRKEHK